MALNFDLKKKILFLVLGSLLFILFYQIALYKDYNRYAIRIPSATSSELTSSNPRIIHFEDDHHHKHDDTTVADALKEQIKIFCWVMTSPGNHQTKAIHVLETWGKRCNKILFATEKDTNGGNLPLLIVNTTHGRDHLTAKTMQTFDYLYNNHLDDFDWFLKADDDTYVILENMRYFLSDQNASKPIFFGHHFKPYVDQGYFSGGAGYILSREALRRFGLRSVHDCSKDDGAEDIEMGLCMQRLGVKAGDSRDALGRSRFHCFDPQTHIHGAYPEWYLQYDKYGAKRGIESISDYAITFHYVSVEQMYNLEFFIYHLRPYGIVSGRQELNIGDSRSKAVQSERSDGEEEEKAVEEKPGHVHVLSTVPASSPLPTFTRNPSSPSDVTKKRRRRRRKNWITNSFLSI